MLVFGFGNYWLLRTGTIPQDLRFWRCSDPLITARLLWWLHRSLYLVTQILAVFFWHISCLMYLIPWQASEWHNQRSPCHLSTECYTSVAIAYTLYILLFIFSIEPWHANNSTPLLVLVPSSFSQLSWILMLFICNNPVHVHEHAGTAAGCRLITLSNSPAPPTASSPRGSAPLLMETNSGSARGRGVSKHPLSSYEKLAQYRNPSRSLTGFRKKH